MTKIDLYEIMRRKKEKYPCYPGYPGKDGCSCDTAVGDSCDCGCHTQIHLPIKIMDSFKLFTLAAIIFLSMTIYLNYSDNRKQDEIIFGNTDNITALVESDTMQIEMSRETIEILSGIATEIKESKGR